MGMAFQAYLGWGGGGLFNLKTTMVSVLNKELEYKVEKLKNKFRSCSLGSESNLNFQMVNKLSRIRPHKVLQSWLINTVFHLLVKNN